MDKNEIENALHEISMMVSVALGAVETLQATDTTPRVFQMPDEAGELLSFSALTTPPKCRSGPADGSPELGLSNDSW
jgi:hypothetical protein